MIYVCVLFEMRTTPIHRPLLLVLDVDARHAIADSPEIFASMTPQEILANFGGRQRLQRLGRLLQAQTVLSEFSQIIYQIDIKRN